MSPSEPSLSFNAFVREVLDALEAAHVTYLIGGAVALAAWGEARTTRDLNLVIDLSVESMGALSLELERRAMLVPVDIMLDLLIEDRADLPINAFTWSPGTRLRCSCSSQGMRCERQGCNAASWWTWGRRWARSTSIRLRT